MAVLNREVSVLRSPTSALIGFWPGRYDADRLRADIGSAVFADLVSIGDIRVETE